MQDLLEQLEKHLSAIENKGAELLQPATNEELGSVEKELGVKFPEEFRQLYRWHNGNLGDLFLFGEFRIAPLRQIVELHDSAHRASDDDYYEVSDDSGVFKDCIANRKWIQFADNGGNTIVLLDLDPGKAGTVGQLLEVCDGDVECRFASIRDFISDLNDRITKNELAWDDEAGTFHETHEQSVAQRRRFKEKIQLFEDSPTFRELLHMQTGEVVTVAGAIRPNHKTGKHELYMHGGSIPVAGDIGDIHIGLAGAPPMVKITLRAGKKSLFGLGAPVYEVVYCERVPQ